jgi:hypothetical protein
MSRDPKAIAAATPMATNVTANGIERSGLRAGDYIRSNDAMNALIMIIAGDIIVVETLKGTVMNITADNKIDLIC